MRDIKFRGKSIETTAWTYGGYVKFIDSKGEEYHIIITFSQDAEPDFVPVIPETVGQHTGRDNIYQGDIVAGNFPKAQEGVVVWDKARAGFYIKPFSYNNRAAYDKYYKMNSTKLTVVGNLWNNPEYSDGRKH
jgi:hypothetical protein